MNNSKIEFSEAKKLVDEFQWWHQTFEIYPGIITPGAYDPEFLMKKIELPGNLTGARVLDIGACDGYFSRQLDRRGADVVALDYKTKEFSGFSIMEKLYGKSIKHINCNIYEIEKYVGGKFDIVLMLGVIYHLPDIIRALWLTRQFCNNIFVLETYCEDHSDPEIPLMKYYKSSSLANDMTNFWSPNKACVLDMLEDVGFSADKIERFGDRLFVQCSVSPEEPSNNMKLMTAYGKLGK